ncbi:MAG TPA: Flp family type IVb pilin [Gemmataceae bacterium]|nr:Flp family type IVb pilin [Gemmataceae bacterium]
MHHLEQRLVDFLRNEDGPAPVEVAVLLALVVMVGIGSLNSLGLKVGNTFSTVASKLTVPGGS